ncbi:MAG TPA: hypothetical protein PLR25_15290 [Planctomycetaceae bacterium]|nr:hypothetical protein [Planctomycetaceae bacterium]
MDTLQIMTQQVSIPARIAGGLEQHRHPVADLWDRDHCYDFFPHRFSS